MFLISAAVYYFMIPAQLVVGSISGLVLVLTNIIPLSQSVLTFILNALLLIVGYIFIGREFGTKTVVTSFMLPAFLAVFEIISPNNQMLVDSMFTNMVAFLILISFGQSILFNANASSGGLDIVAKLFNKYLRVELGVGIQIAGFVTAATAILVYDTEILIYSLLGTFFNGILLDYFIGGYHMKKKICIITPNYERIRDYVVNELGRGVTFYKVCGGLDNSEKVEVVTILQKNEYQLLLDYIRKTDEQAFVSVTSIGEVVGFWNNVKRKRIK
ncbi:MAG: YitT family protein [Clostridiales bacterium]|nr:YitT family protein [Clostridiales bacterium]